MPPKRATRTSPSQARATPSAERQLERQGPPPVVHHEEQEVNQPECRGESQVGAQEPPPPPVIDLVQVMNNQTLLLEALANAITRQRPRGQGMNEKLTDFLRYPLLVGPSTPWTQMTGCGSSRGSWSRFAVRAGTRFSWLLINSLGLL